MRFSIPTKHKPIFSIYVNSTTLLKLPPCPSSFCLHYSSSLDRPLTLISLYVNNTNSKFGSNATFSIKTHPQTIFFLIPMAFSWYFHQLLITSYFLLDFKTSPYHRKKKKRKKNPTKLLYIRIRVEKTLTQLCKLFWLHQCSMKWGKGSKEEQ